LIKCKHGITIPDVSELEKTVETNNYSILMMDNEKNIIVEIKDVGVLKTMYFFYDEDIERLEKGEIINFRASLPLPPHPDFLFKKNNMK
jgi:hypothetical protein